MLVRIERIFAVPREPRTRTVSPGFNFNFVRLLKKLGAGAIVKLFANRVGDDPLPSAAYVRTPHHFADWIVRDACSLVDSFRCAIKFIRGGLCLFLSYRLDPEMNRAAC